MGKRKGFLPLIIILLLTGLAAFAAACGKSENGFNAGDYSFPADQTVSFGGSYTPVITVSNKVSVKSVTLKDVLGNPVAIGEDYGFTPDGCGVFVYGIVFSKGGSEQAESFNVYVVDTVAPTVTAPVQDKAGVEIGYYDGFAANLAALQVRDDFNEADTLVIKVVDITFDGATESRPEGFTGYMLDQIGVYSVGITVDDLSGNSVRTGYTITTCDTTKPVIERLRARNAWIDAENRIKLPAVTVIEVGEYTLSATARFGGKDTAVSGGYITAAGLGDYTVTYTATDASGNVSEPMTATVRAVASGLINDFSDGSELGAWETVGLETRYENNSMLVYGDGNGRVTAHLTENDWSAYSYLMLSVSNYRAMDSAVSVVIVSNGKEYTLHSFRPALATASGEYLEAAVTDTDVEIDIGRLGIPLGNVEKLILKVASDNACKLAVNGLRLLSARTQGFEVPVPDAAETYGFETALSKAQTFGGGSTLNSDADYILSGTRSGGYRLAAGGYTGEYWTNGLTASVAGANTVELYLFSFIQTEIRLGGMFGGTELSSGYFPVEPGWNRLCWYVGIDNDFALSDVALSGLILFSGSAYDTTVYVDCIALTKVTAFESDEVLRDKSLSVPYGQSLAVPSPLKLSSKYIASVDAALLSGVRDAAAVSAMEGYGINGDTRVTLYENLEFDTHGDYTLVYLVEDVLGGKHLAVYPLTAEKKLLSISAPVNKITAGDTVQLPSPELSSDILGGAALADAEIRLYYRENGKYNWLELDGGRFAASKAGFYDIKYEAYAGEYFAELVLLEFAHAEGTHVDFEMTMGAPLGYGEDYNRRLVRLAGRDPYAEYVYLATYHSDEWAFDGMYSIRFVPERIGWAGFYHPETIVVESGTNAISVWIYANQPVRGAQFCVWASAAGQKKDWIYSGEFDIDSGARCYTIVFESEFDETDGITFYIPYDPTKVLYFDAFAYITAE